MYIDFEINDTGDLIFQRKEKSYNPLKVKFNLSQTNVQKITFHIEENYYEKETKDNSLKVSFFIKKEKDVYSANYISSEDALMQLIKLKMKTTLGELPLRKDFGSILTTVKHANMDSSNLRRVELIIIDCLKDLIRNPQVTVSPYINYKNGYQQTVKIKIFNDSDFLLEYVMER